MKNVYTLISFFLLCTLQMVAQTNINWSTPITVADGNQFGSMRPRIAFADGQPVILWGKSSTRDVFVSRFDGSLFSTPVNVSDQNLDAFVFNWTGPEITGSGNDVFVTYTTEPAEEGKVVLVKSVDGGLTFSDTVNVDPPDSDLPRFSSVKIDENGNPLVLYMQFDSTFGNPVNVLSRSMNGGISFMNPVEASSVINGDPCDCCNGYLIVDENYVLNLFRNNENNIRDSWCAISTNDGASFNESVRVDTNNWMMMTCPSSTPVGLVKGDQLISAFMNAADGMTRLYISKTDLTNQNFIFHRMFKMSSQNQNHPRIAGDDDVTGIVWSESSEVMFTYSMDDDSLGMITDTLNSMIAGFTQNPDIIYAEGKFHVTWENMTSGEVYYSVGDLGLPSGTEEFFQSEENYTISKTAKGYFINSQNAASIELFSINGQSGGSQFIQAGENFLFNTQFFSSGIYLLRIQTDSNCFTEKLLVE